MAFETLSDRLKIVAERALVQCKARYGGNGVKIETGISDTILWRPTFFIKVGKSKIIAVEVEDNLYPNILSSAAHQISHFDFPVSVYQACSLEAYQNDPKQTKVRALKTHGFGIITVDDDGTVVFQHPCVPLAQHISEDALEREIGPLSKSLKVLFRQAHETYVSNIGQGLQIAGQIIEAIVFSLGKSAHKAGLITQKELNGNLAGLIDALYAHNSFTNYRAALGAARDFVKEFRNTASHAPKNGKEAADKIRKCKRGFSDAIVIAEKLKNIASAMNYKISVHIT